MDLTKTKEAQALLEKWGSVLDHKSYAPITESRRRSITALLLENAASELMTEAPTNVSGTDGFTGDASGAGPVAGYNPVLINLIRRTMPNLVAYDIAGVQPLTGPSGLVFALRGMYTTPGGTEAFYNEADTAFSGAGTHGNGLGLTHATTTGTGMLTADGELLGTASGDPWPEMAIALDSVNVKVKTRALKATWSTEMDQDLRHVHGLDLNSEMVNLLATEILAEMNREVLRTIYLSAVQGAAVGTATAGTFDLDVDANGRHAAEKFKGLMFQVEREAHAVAKGTRRGKGNIIICSAEVASALEFAGMLNYAPALNTNGLTVDDTGNTFAGILNNRYRVYIDPYAADNYMVVGYKGSSIWDAGLFYAPYQPLQLHQTIDSSSLQPVIGFKTRYGLVSNPFAGGLVKTGGALTANTNQFYRRTLVRNIL